MILCVSDSDSMNENDSVMCIFVCFVYFILFLLTQNREYQLTIEGRVLEMGESTNFKILILIVIVIMTGNENDFVQINFEFK